MIVRTTLPAVALTVIWAAPIAAVEVAANFKAVLPLPGEGRPAGVKAADTPAGSPCSAKLTAELNPPSIAEVKVAVAVPPRLSVNAVLLALSAEPGMDSVKVAVLVTSPPVAVTVSG